MHNTVHFVSSYVNFQGSLKAMNLHAQTLLCGTETNFVTTVHAFPQSVGHTHTYTKLLNTQRNQI
jgi:hypothetical protein